MRCPTCSARRAALIQATIMQRYASFVAAIKLKQLRQGSRIDRYIKDLPALSPYIARLIKYYKGHYLLANSDIESLDYKLALLACFALPTNYNP